ncbi:MAG TPA: hypothetical protein IGS53_07370 [Leptolyngbyaceae cyanobacterium M33_DOE_097]|uniref:Uncharacterized protein n=1 Tax=Oscillatoriales cyanobacterium SpSt-418 TaxID=2282169 RepID=A0A7C3PE83_9CYAN|nr:hypothetical protein [Leptolyngbyaceae cyanobacterium M33_DOE_097]
MIGISGDLGAAEPQDRGTSPLPKHFRWHSVSEKYFVPRLVGASLPYNPRKVVCVGVEWSASQMLRVTSLALRSLTEGTGDVRRRLRERSPLRKV